MPRLCRRILLPAPLALLALLALLASGAALACGCRPGEAAWLAKLASEEEHCPLERVTARERPELVAHRFACATPHAPWALRAFALVSGRSPSGVPDGPELEHQCGLRPPDVLAGDAERLRLWHEANGEPLRLLDTAFGAIYEITACGKQVFYAHYHEGRHGGGLIPLGSAEPPH